MDTLTTIRVPTTMRDRLKTLAAEHDTTLAGAVEIALHAVDRDRFWEQMHAAAEADGDRLVDEVEGYSGTLADGLIDEDWSDLYSHG